MINLDKGINVLSLFDGMSCGQIALERCGIKVNNYFASEIDKYSIAVTQYNYSNTIQLGDIRKIKYENNILYSEKNKYDIDKIDLIIGGSPCQGFSFSGKRLNFEDERSKLFFEFYRLLKECNPSYFLLENVMMDKKSEHTITNYLDTIPIKINSSLVSAQSRKRLYWTNISKIYQPKNKKIILKDIIEEGIIERDKSYCIDANYYKGTNLEHYLKKKRRQIIFSNKLHQVGSLKDKNMLGNRVYDINGKGKTFTIGDSGLYAISLVGRHIENGKRKDIKGSKTTQMLETTFSEKSNTLSTVQKDSLLLLTNNCKNTNLEKKLNKPDKLFNLGPYKQATTVLSIKGKGMCLCSQGGGIAGMSCNLILQHINKEKDDFYIRKLTPIECERLQTVPDNYTKYGKFENNKIDEISKTQRYKMLGNGWTVDVIVHIFNHLKNFKAEFTKVQKEMFSKK